MLPERQKGSGEQKEKTIFKRRQSGCSREETGQDKASEDLGFVIDGGLGL